MGMDRIQVALEWEGELYFAGKAGDVDVAVDGDAERSQSPMQALGTALAGCMGIDIVHILNRMRTPADGVRMSFDGQRATSDPRRYERIELHVEVEGDVPEKNLQRAVDMSRDKYCSVMQSLHTDIEIVIRSTVTAAS